MAETSCLTADIKRGMQKYLVDMLVALAVYGLVLVASISWLKRVHPAAPLKYVVAALPLLPALLIPRIVIRAFRSMDELQQKIHLEALAFAFTGSAILTFGYGFLENVGLPHLNWTLVWPVMSACWVIGVVKACAKYR